MVDQPHIHDAALRTALNREARLPEHVVFRAFPAETVVLNLESGRYHGLNLTGGRMLEVLGATPRLDDAVGRLAAEFDAPAERIARDVVALCAALVDRGLLVVEPAGAGDG
jgi:coenzyme PQQ synthesis protein D (PqqD)